MPGILYGRYLGDVYEGGNPWQLLSASLAELFYSGASDILDKYNERSNVTILDEDEVLYRLIFINIINIIFRKM